MVNKTVDTLKGNFGEIKVTYLDKKLAHMVVPRALLGETIVPGISLSASSVDIVVAKSYDDLFDLLDILGARWLIDAFKPGRTLWLTDIIYSSVVMRFWPTKTMWVAVPLGRANANEWSMPMVNPELHRPEPLMDCKSTIMIDQFSGVSESTLTSCSNSLTHLVGECFLGCASCSICLGRNNAPSEH